MLLFKNQAQIFVKVWYQTEFVVKTNMYYPYCLLKHVSVSFFTPSASFLDTVIFRGGLDCKLSTDEIQNKLVLDFFQFGPQSYVSES